MNRTAKRLTGWRADLREIWRSFPPEKWCAVIAILCAVFTIIMLWNESHP